MNAGIWVFVGAMIWFLLAALAGPAEKARQDELADPY